MKAKYIEWHNNYPFELGEIYDIMPYDDEWVRFEYDNQLYRKECFEFVGVLKALVSHVDDFGLLPKTINQIQRETIVNEYTELEAKAAKWDMIQWAMDEMIEFVYCSDTENADFVHINEDDFKHLEQLYKEHERVEHSFDSDGNERMRGTLG